MYIKYFNLILLLLVGCKTPQEEEKSPWKMIASRDKATPIYRSKIASLWSEEKLPPDELRDTTKPNAKFTLSQIVLTIHNFPSDELEKRIPPQAQVSRWKRQFEKNPQLSPKSHGGFIGLLYEGQNEELAVMALAMQLDTEHYLKLTDREMRADYTIKAVGPKSEIEKYRSEILKIMNNFELTEEIPS